MAKEEANEDLCVVMSRRTGFMSSDREPENKVFGPTSKAACDRYIEDATWGDGIGGSGRVLWVKPVKVTYEY